MLNMRALVGEADLLMITFDALRYDVAVEIFNDGRTPFLQQTLRAGWEERHSPGNFTYAAHAAFFAGFFPTPAAPGRHVRPLALRFQGSVSIGKETSVLEGASIVEGLQLKGYHTICIGGVGFFNKLNPLGRVFPSLFDESHWAPEFSVSEPHSTRNQVLRATERIASFSSSQPLFVFVNLSALHGPNYFYLPGAVEDTPQTQAAALEYVDRQLPPLFEALRSRGRPGAGFLFSDHGTAYGEDGYQGHRLAHPVVWNVPYGECAWEGER
ncbi:MAG: STM4013/SEN3800 family hydrolase [Planctomycetia bacterium]|nr:STM4013/SEN3800 family hydrolase [Planctomycetia bacterium]